MGAPSKNGVGSTVIGRDTGRWPVYIPRVHTELTTRKVMVQERLDENAPRAALGNLGPSHDVCPADCCVYQPRRP